jgi:hypothetical protein
MRTSSTRWASKRGWARRSRERRSPWTVIVVHRSDTPGVGASWSSQPPTDFLPRRRHRGTAHARHRDHEGRPRPSTIASSAVPRHSRSDWTPQSPRSRTVMTRVRARPRCRDSRKPSDRTHWNLQVMRACPPEIDPHLAVVGTRPRQDSDGCPPAKARSFTATGVTCWLAVRRWLGKIRSCVRTLEHAQSSSNRGGVVGSDP